MKEFKDQEKDIDIYSILKTHMPIIACIAAAIISAMFLFKGLNNVSTLDILQNFWIIGIIGTISYVVTFAIVKIVKKQNLIKLLIEFSHGFKYLQPLVLHFHTEPMI